MVERKFSELAMRKTQEDDDVFDHLTSTNQRLMREMEAFLSSMDTSSDDQAPLQTSAARPQPQSILSPYVNPEWQKSHDCGVIFERSAEDCDSQVSESYLQKINEGQSSTVDHDDFDNRLQRIDDTIDTALNNLQSQSQGRKPAEYEYYNDPKYQRQTRDHSLDDDSLVAIAKRLDEASIMSDPSVICGTKEKFLLLTASAKRSKKQGYNRKSAKNDFPGTTRRDRAARRSSNSSSTSSSTSSRDKEPSSNPTIYITEDGVLKSTPAAKKGTTATVDNKSISAIPKSHAKDDDKRTYKNGSADEWRKENYRQPRPSSKAGPSSNNDRKKSSSKEAACLQGDKSRRKQHSAAAAGGFAQTIPRSCYSDFRSGATATALHSSQDTDTDDGEDACTSAGAASAVDLPTLR